MSILFREGPCQENADMRKFELFLLQIDENGIEKSIILF